MLSSTGSASFVVHYKKYMKNLVNVHYAVILPEGYQNELLNDSKQLTEKKRYQLREMIERDAVAWAVGIVTPEEIDKINILNASILAMHRALDQLKVRPEAIIVDGNRFKKYKDLPHTTIVKGDGKYLSIAAASILAKTYRDDYMNQLAERISASFHISQAGLMAEEDSVLIPSCDMQIEYGCRIIYDDGVCPQKGEHILVYAFRLYYGAF